MKRSLLYKAFILGLSFLFFAQRLCAQGSTVTPIGPDGGIVNVVKGTTNDSIVLAGTRNNGVYRSLNGGTSWMPTTLTAASVNDIVFHPSIPLTVYAATKEGLYVSYDGGTSWTLTSLTIPTSTIAIYAQAPLIMFAGDGRQTLQGSSGVYKTTDGGLSWMNLSTGLTVSKSITALAIDTTDVVAGMTVYAGTDNAGVYSTNDGGNTWNPFVKNTGLVGLGLRIHFLSILPGTGLTAGTSSGEYFCPGGTQWIRFTGTSIDDSVIQCSFTLGDTAATDTFYIGTKGNEETFPPMPVKGGLYRTTTLGVTWTPLFKSSLDVNSIFIPASNAQKIYLATSGGIYLSSDAGTSWVRSNTGMMNSIARTIAVVNSTKEYLIAGVYGGGVLKSTNAGATWIPSNSGIENPYIRAIVADPKNNATLYAGSVYGLYKSADTGNTWQKVSLSSIAHDSLSPFNNNSEDGTVKISPVDSHNLFVAALTGEFLSSSDGGVTWNSLTPPQKVLSPLVENIEFDPINASTLYFSANGVWKSTDLGKTWASITGDLPLNVSVGGTIYPLLGFHPRIDPKNPNVLFLSTMANSMLNNEYKTTNGGLNWTSLNAVGFDIAFDPAQSSTVFCAGSNGILRSPDAGMTWTKIGGDPSTQYYSTTQIPANDSTIFIGSNHGVTSVSIINSLTISPVNFDFGTVAIGSVTGQSITFNNVGQQSITIGGFSFSGSSGFSLAANATPLTLKPGISGTITMQFMPKSTGAYQATLTLTTDDPSNPAVAVSLRGTGVPITSVSRTVLLETTHGISSNLGASSITQYLSEFVQALQRSGITVEENQKPFDPLAAPFNAIIIAAPKTAYSLVEINELHQYVANGGLVVMLGDSGNSDANICLNGILSNFQWTLDPPFTPTGLSLNYDVVTNPTTNYLGNATSPIFSAFTDTAQPFVKGVKTIVSFGSSSIAVSGQAIPFLKGSSTTFAISSDSTQSKTLKPTVAAMNQIGKGTIFLIGDVDIWSNVKGKDTLSPLPTGILAGDNLQFALDVFGYTGNYTAKVPNPTLSNQYQIISVPFDLVDFTIADVLKDLGNVDKTKWRLYGRWDGAEYLEFPSPGFLTFRRGEGYWLITKGSQSLTLGSATVSSAQGFFPIQLDSGYNLIGNPFPYPVSWANSQHSTPDSVESWLWGFDGVGFQQETNVMQPFTGYFLKSLHNGVTIYINPNEASSAGSLAKQTNTTRQFAANEWQVRISASDDIAADNDNVVGVLRSASDEWDAEDFSEPPPAPSNYLALSFNHENWKNNPGRYAGDFRSIHQEGNYWDFDIASAKVEASVSVQFNKSGNIPPEFEIYLVDMTTERAHDVGSALSYNFAFLKNELDRSFRLVVGTKDFIGKNTNGIPIVPIGYSLEQNFPNPFNPSTIIAYTLGHSTHVELEVFNVLGQKVKTLFAGDEKIGSYTVAWDGTNDYGSKISSGVYFYRIRTEQFSSTKKLMLLK